MTTNKPANGAELFAEDLSALEIIELPSDAALASFGTLSSGSSASCPSSASSASSASSFG